MRRLAAALLRRLAEAVVRLYYPWRTVEGRDHLPAAGPTLYVANHPNGLMDPLVLRVTTGRPIRFLAKSTFWNNPFGRLAMDAFRCLMIYRQQDLPTDGEAGARAATGEIARDRNEETFARCRVELAGGAELALYPEGVSHSEPQLRPLKSGAARLALTALAEAAARGGPALALVPVGAWYERKVVFRSGLRLVVGAPIDTAAAQAAFAADARQGVATLTGIIRERIGELVLRAEAGARLTGAARVVGPLPAGPAVAPGEAGPRNVGTWLATYARLKATQTSGLHEVTRPVLRFERTARWLGLEPWAAELPPVSWAPLAAAAGGTLALAPLALWGIVTTWVPFRLSGWVAGRLTRDDDVLSTFKMIIGGAFLTGAWLLEAVALGIGLGAGWGVLSFLLAPAAAYAGLRWAELIRAFAAGGAALGWRGGAAGARRLTETRQAAAGALARVLDEAAVDQSERAS